MEAVHLLINPSVTKTVIFSIKGFMNAKSGKVTMHLRIVLNVYLYKSTVLYFNSIQKVVIKNIK